MVPFPSKRNREEDATGETRMNELLEQILEDIVQMSEEGLYPPHVCQKILDQIEAREYEYSAMIDGRYPDE